ncbi:16742_t:CDS:2 [Entrophospora sp. SA101]|nr:16742_t:CDS:2 [Entrophospora sp. SA101]
MDKFSAFIKKIEDSIYEDSSEACTHCNSNGDNEKPRDWLQSGWAFDCVESKKVSTYNAQFNVKKCLGTIECEMCDAQTRPIIKGHGKKIEEQINKDCSVPTCNDQLRERIRNAPETLPKKLLVGQSLDENHPLSSVRNISESFTNSDRVGYYRRAIIDEENIITKTAHQHGDNFFLDILQHSYITIGLDAATRFFNK